MNITELSEIHTILQNHNRDTARAWMDALTTLTPVTLDVTQLRARFEGFVDRLTTLMVSEPFTPGPAQEVGAALDMLENFQSKDLVKVQEVLAGELVKGLSPEQVVLLLPRMVAVLSELENGVFIGKANRAKRFDMESMSKMGHDLKTPINAITGFSRVILKGIDGPITEFQQQDLTSIYDAGKKLLDMINDMFEVAKGDAAKTNLYEKSFEVADLLGDLLRTVQPILAKREYAIDLWGGGDLGKMQADASQVRWTLIGLLFHAARLAERGGVSLATAREQTNNGDWLLFEVTQTPEEKLLMYEPQDLQPFEEPEETMDVALITALRFCKDMGGTISLTKDEAGTNKFLLRLPARVIVAEPA